jgi:hypothetical protein
MIEGNYFPHKIGARNDPKLVALERGEGKAGKGVWWDLVDYLYECDGYLPADLDLVAYAIHADPAQVSRVVMNYGLFVQAENGCWTNNTAQDCIERRNAATEQKREAGRQGGLARGRQQRAAEALPQAPLEAPLEAAPQAPLEANKINQINKSNKSNPGNAPAQERAREEGLEDLFYEIFFRRDFISPAAEVRRVLKYCKENEVKDPRKLAESWAPENKAPRFNDPAVIDWCLRLEREIIARSDPAEGMEFLRAIDAISVDKRNHVLKVRMRSQAWGETVAAMTEETPELCRPYDKVEVTKRNPATL